MINTCPFTKTYVYSLFLRHAETGEVQYGKVEIDIQGILGSADLFKRLEHIAREEGKIEADYTLIGIQIVDVFPKKVEP